MYVFIIFLSGLDISLHVNSPCRAEGSRTELSVVGGGRELESCRCKGSWEGSPLQS